MGGTHRHKRLTTHSTTKEGVGEAGGGGDRAAASSCESGSGGRRRGRRLRGQLHGREPAARAMAPARAAGARAARARAATTAAAPPEGGGDDDGAAWRPCAAGSGCTKARDEHGRQYMRKAVCKRWRAFGSRVMRTRTTCACTCRRSAPQALLPSCGVRGGRGRVHRVHLCMYTALCVYPPPHMHSAVDACTTCARLCVPVHIKHVSERDDRQVATHMPVHARVCAHAHAHAHGGTTGADRARFHGGRQRLQEDRLMALALLRQPRGRGEPMYIRAHAHAHVYVRAGMSMHALLRQPRGRDEPMCIHVRMPCACMSMHSPPRAAARAR